MIPYPDGGQLRIIARFHWSAFSMVAFRPRAIINGHGVDLRWGENVVPAPHGEQHVEIYVPFLYKGGRAQITVDNTGSVPTVHYCAPSVTFMRGAIGLTPQRFPGKSYSLTLVGLVVMAVLGCVGAQLFLGK